MHGECGTDFESGQDESDSFHFKLFEIREIVVEQKRFTSSQPLS